MMAGATQASLPLEKPIAIHLSYYLALTLNATSILQYQEHDRYCSQVAVDGIRW